MNRFASIILLAVTVLVYLPSDVKGQTPPPTEPIVIISGDGLVKATPDQALVMLATESRSKNPKDAQTQNANTMSAVQQKLVASGIAKDAIRTLSYDLQLESDWVNGRMVPRGYVARNLVEVRLDDISRVGEVIDVAVTSGVNSVQGVRFDLKNRSELEREALKRATADARMRADAAAAGAGRTIDRVIKIEEPANRPYPVRPEMMMRQSMAADKQTETTPIVAGEIEIRSTVVITATLK